MRALEKRVQVIEQKQRAQEGTQFVLLAKDDPMPANLPSNAVVVRLTGNIRPADL